METVEGLKRKLGSTEDLQSVVKTMKAMAAVNIRQYEKAVRSLADYARTVELGLAVVLGAGGRPPRARRTAHGNLGVIVFGSDQGMAGSLNEQVAALTIGELRQAGVALAGLPVVAVGQRVLGPWEDAGGKAEAYLQVPGSIAGITPLVHQLLFHIQTWGEQRGIDRVWLFYNRQLGGAAYRPIKRELLPLDRDWLDRLVREPWAGPSLPTFTMDPQALFSALLRQYLFIGLFQALAESAASENASRLAAMQGAEKSIGERLDELTQRYFQRRQSAITEELLDIVSGYEAFGEQS
ncbi:MAG: F0F1 ATP synthase subunit gamma [Desulfarculaceae bacterium]|nr:F0F1 ATP synthase subunit gamma [Desulfarculaceae bacterium]MCF8048659.1 F0F1 ATP synthase subunit gamma [Desulfarculaceae bacterium]MCF8066133.1 F0F1 ATP synthase subunit gamma [Desulfarculaceae bacterium]MCF8099245.1 F0F1 ATP synthase subunit gamma [Desulfarculaceae bacterium]